MAGFLNLSPKSNCELRKKNRTRSYISDVRGMCVCLAPFLGVRFAITHLHVAAHFAMVNDNYVSRFHFVKVFKKLKQFIFLCQYNLLVYFSKTLGLF